MNKPINPNKVLSVVLKAFVDETFVAFSFAIVIFEQISYPVCLYGVASSKHCCVPVLKTTITGTNITIKTNETNTETIFILVCAFLDFIIFSIALFCFWWNKKIPYFVTFRPINKDLKLKNIIYFLVNPEDFTMLKTSAKTINNVVNPSKVLSVVVRFSALLINVTITGINAVTKTTSTTTDVIFIAPLQLIKSCFIGFIKA